MAFSLKFRGSSSAQAWLKSSAWDKKISFVQSLRQSETKNLIYHCWLKNTFCYLSMGQKELVLKKHWKKSSSIILKEYFFAVFCYFIKALKTLNFWSHSIFKAGYTLDYHLNLLNWKVRKVNVVIIAALGRMRYRRWSI